MGFWIELITHRLFIACVLTAIVAQLIKMILVSVKTGRIEWNVFGLPGGMPSSHAAVVVAMTGGIYWQQGVTPLTIAAGVIAAIVIYDALTLRRAVGKQSEALNNLAKKLKIKGHKKVQSLLGHKVVEIIAGGVLGYVIAWAAFHL
ncbi:MAG: divergent PAP2 family protein [Candidatus Woesearchaeota archaeon]